MKFIRANLKARLDLVSRRILWLPTTRRGQRRHVLLTRIRSALWRDIHELRRRDPQACADDYRGWTLHGQHDRQPVLPPGPPRFDWTLDGVGTL